MTCSHDPSKVHGPIGQYHCPECGEMVLAGVPHPDYEEMNRHLARMAVLRRGDLVVTIDGYLAIVLDPLPHRDNTSKIVVAVANGLEEEINWWTVRQVLTLPDSEAHCNFAEWLYLQDRIVRPE